VLVLPQKQKWTFEEWYAKYGDGLPFVPEGTYQEHRRRLAKRVSWAMRDFDFEDGHSPCVMFGAGYARAGKYRYKWCYSHTVLDRFIRMKKLTILNYDDASRMYDLVLGKRRPEWHNFQYLSQTYCFVPRRADNMVFGAYVGGIRIDALSIEQVAQIEKLRAVGEKLDKILSQIDQNAEAPRMRKQKSRQKGGARS
jgi:hypothetical protein